MTSQNENKKREFLILMEMTFITVLVLSDWTILFKDIRPEILFTHNNNWIRILTYIPLIWILQLHAIGINKYFRLSFLYYLLLFCSLLIRISKDVFIKPSIVNFDCDDWKRLISSLIFQLIMGLILLLIYKTRNARVK